MTQPTYTYNRPGTSNLEQQNERLKGIVFFLGIVLLLVIGALGMWFYQQTAYTQKTTVNQPAVAPPSSTPIPQIQDTVVGSPIKKTGSISGKLCYPSDFLPKGEIVAKNLLTAEITTQDYAGSSSGAGSTYSIELMPGEYNLRYQAHASGKDPTVYMSGYHTKCDGSAACDENAHTLLPIKVLDGQTINDVDLCDFYYQNEPNF